MCEDDEVHHKGDGARAAETGDCHSTSNKKTQTHTKANALDRHEQRESLQSMARLFVRTPT